MAYYNLHDLLRIDSNVEEFPEIFKSKPFSNADITIREGNFSTNTSKFKKLGLKFFGGDDNLFLEYPFYGRSVQKLLISNLMNGSTRFNFSKFTGKFWGVRGLVYLIMEIKLLQKGCTFIHSGGITKNGKAYLISAWSEMGKSSTVFGLARSGYGVLGDDTLILSRDGTIYSYPQVAGIYFHSKNLENLKLSPSQKVNLFIKYMVSKLPPLHLYINPNLYVDLSSILKVEKSAKLERCYFLEMGKGEEKLDKKTAVNKMISTTVQALFGQFFTREVFYAYCYLNDLDPEFIEYNMRKVLDKTLKDCRIIKSEDKTFYKHIIENV